MINKSLINYILLNIHLREEKYNKNLQYDDIKYKHFIGKDEENAFVYFLQEDIRKILGDEEIDENNAEIVNTKEGIILETNYGVLKIHFINTQIGFQIVGCIGSEEVFSIARIQNNLFNQVTANGITYHYSVDKDDSVFTYAEQAYEENLYQGRLQALNAKIKDYENFKYERDIPPVKKHPSILHQILDMVNDYTSIKTSMELCDITEFTGEIFEKLKAKAENERIQTVEQKVRQK